MSKEQHPLINVEEVKPLLNKISIFGGLNEKQLNEIYKLLRTVKFAQGEYIYKRGEVLSCIYIIKQGRVRMQIEDKGLLIELITFNRGDCFGETSVIGIQSHSSNALAIEASELIILEPSQLHSIFESDKEVFGMLILNIARETARRLHQSNEALVQHMLIKKEK